MSGQARTVLVAGHESDRGAALAPIADTLGAVITTSGRPLHGVVSALLTEGEDRVVVVPMTWGRDPVMVADTAKTLRWIRATAGAGRAAHLVRTHGAGVPIEVACVAEPGDMVEVVRRARLLGADRVVVVPAGFAHTAPAGLAEDASFFGPLLSDEALREVVRRRVATAEHDLQHGDDGIAAGLLADHGHGYAHSHVFEAGAGHALDDHDVLSMLYVLTSQASVAEVTELLHSALAPSTTGGVVFGVSALPGDAGVWVRLLGEDTRSVGAATTLAWQSLRRLLTGGTAPTIRKT